jgi:hypothetical protein
LPDLPESARPARDARARNASPVPAKPARASASAARETVPARPEGNVTATATAATVTARTIREEGHKMASQNEIVWKKDLTDIQSGLETLATKTKISIDLSRWTMTR